MEVIGLSSEPSAARRYVGCVLVCLWVRWLCRVCLQILCFCCCVSRIWCVLSQQVISLFIKRCLTFYPMFLVNVCNPMYTFTLQNVSLVNTVLATIVADTFREFSEAIEKGQMPKTVAQKALKESWKVIVLCCVVLCFLWMVVVCSIIVDRLNVVALNLDLCMHTAISIQCSFLVYFSPFFSISCPVSLIGYFQRQWIRWSQPSEAERRWSVVH